MVNKVLNFSIEQPAKSNLMVYSDISLQASQAPVVFRPQKLPKDTGAYLAWGNTNNENITVTSPDNEGQIFIINGNQYTEFANNVAYNQDQKNKAHFKLNKNINVNAIKQSIKNIFSWMPGERVLNPEFGSKLRSYLYQGITTYNTEAIMAEIQRCFTVWEPRAKLVSVANVSNIDDTEDNTVQIEIVYTIPSLSPEQYSYTMEVQKAV